MTKTPIPAFPQIRKPPDLEEGVQKQQVVFCPLPFLALEKWERVEREKVFFRGGRKAIFAWLPW